MTPPRKRNRPTSSAQRPRQAPFTQNDIARAAGLAGFRQKTGMTQTDLAAQLGVSQPTVAAYENGRYPIPDDVFEALLELARAHAAGETAGGQVPPADGAATGEREPDRQPGPGQSVPPAGDQAPQIDPGQLQQGLSAAINAEITAAEKQMAANLQAVYQLLATGIGRLGRSGDIAGGIIYNDSQPLSQSMVMAARDSVMIRRFIELLSQGPVFNMALLHALTAMKIESAIRSDRQARAQTRELEQHSRPVAAPTPLPPEGAEVVDPVDRYRTAATA